VIHFLLDNGIGQNITASVIIGAPAYVWARIKLWPRWIEHERKVHELHQQQVVQSASSSATRHIDLDFGSR